MPINIPTCPDCVARKIADLQLGLDKLYTKQDQLMRSWKDTEEHDIDCYNVQEEIRDVARVIRSLKQNQ